MVNDALETLPPLHRLALAYTPRPARPAMLALLALDARLAGIVRAGAEPLIAQLKLAWWRDRLGEGPQNWPQGEPLLALLRGWPDPTAALVPLVDGWEALLAEDFDAATAQRFAAGRGAAFASLARGLGAAEVEAAEMAGREWALADLATNLTNPQEQALARQEALAQPWTKPRLSRALRALVVLHGLAQRSLHRQADQPAGARSTLLAAMRLGILGR